MTNKKAIEVLQNMKSDFPLPKAAQTRRAQNDALDVAIEVLKAEPCDDAISRQMAIVQLSHNKIGDDDCDVIIQNDIETIKALPSAQPEHKTGRWIYGQDELFVSCSECGMETTRNELRGIALFGKDEPKFCPNCGAKMEG